MTEGRKAKESNPPVGRPIGFEPGEALDAAVRLFWKEGFEAASMQAIEERTGLSRSSLYNSFGSKRDLYLSALARYQSRLADAMFGPLETGNRGLADLHAFFDRLEGGLGPLMGAGQLPGCFIVNSMVEFGGEDPDVAEFGLGLFVRLREAAHATLTRAARAGEIGEDKLLLKARLVVMIAIGINVKARAGESDRDMADLFEASRDMIESWRLPKPRKPGKPRRKP